MAKLIKDRAKKPVIEQATCAGTQTVHGDKIVYALELFPPHNGPTRGHQVILTPGEMLQVVAAWTSKLAHDVITRERKG